jgi:hypothetical protein
MLSVNALIQAAERDIDIARHNAATKQQRASYVAVGASRRHAGRAQKTSFLPSHVRGATRPSEVLQNALDGVLDGQAKAEGANKFLYESRARLAEAIKLAREYGA